MGHRRINGPAGRAWSRLLRAAALAIAVSVWGGATGAAIAAAPGSGAATTPNASQPEAVREEPPGPPQPPANQAKAAALIDVASGRLLYSRNGDEPMRIASLTKIMTAIVAIESGRLDSELTVSVRAAGKEGSSLYLKVGEKMTLRNALYGLMLRSGNDAAVAIAEHVGGSQEGFVFLMNRKAEEIGLDNSRFMNPHGLDEAGHYSSANDLAKLTAYALHNPEFRDIVGTKVKTAPNPTEPWDYKWVNKNKMLQMYEGADGVKTGYTKLALRCLVSSATRNGQQLAAVTINDSDDWRDHRNLLDYGFASFVPQTIVREGERIGGLEYRTADSFGYPFAAGEQSRLQVRFERTSQLDPAYFRGERGVVRYALDGRDIGAVRLTEPRVASAKATVGRALEAGSRTLGRFLGEAVRALLLKGGAWHG